jgi:hypothetical protein
MQPRSSAHVPPESDSVAQSATQSEKSTMLIALYFAADKSIARQTNRIPINAFAFDESINIKIPPMH